MAFLAFISVSAFLGIPEARSATGIQWQRAFGGTDGDSAAALCLTSDGGYLVGGYSYSSISGSKTAQGFGLGDFWVTRLDASGAALWDKSFGGANFEGIAAIAATADGGFILGGCSYSDASGNKSAANFGSGDFWVVKLDSSGNKQWDQSYGGNQLDALTALQQTRDGGYVLAGKSYSPVSGNKATGNYGGADFWIVKIDGSGTKQWEKTLGGVEADEAHAVRQTADGGYVVGGHSFSGVSGSKSSANFGGTNGTSDFWVVKLDAGGNQQWERTFGGNDAEMLTSLELTGDGGFVAAGHSYSSVSGNKTSPNAGSRDFYLVKLDASGNKQWDRSYGGADADDLHSIEQTRDGGFMLGGVSYSPVSGTKAMTSATSGADSGDYWVLKIDRNGTKQWEQTIPANNASDILRLRQTADGGLLVAGLPTTAGGANSDFVVTKLDGPAYFFKLAMGNNRMVQVQACAMSGSNYVLEASADFATWTSVKTSRASGGVVDLGHTAPVGVINRTFRIRQVP